MLTQFSIFACFSSTINRLKSSHEIFNYIFRIYFNLISLAVQLVFLSYIQLRVNMFISPNCWWSQKMDFFCDIFAKRWRWLLFIFSYLCFFLCEAELNELALFLLKCCLLEMKIKQKAEHVDLNGSVFHEFYNPCWCTLNPNN